MVKKTFLVFLVSLFFISSLVFGQAANESFHATSKPNVFENEKGTTLEYIGLENWNAQTVQDSLKKLAPNRPVHACIAVLKQDLGFKDAQVIAHLNRENNKQHILVTLVEAKREHNLDYWELPDKEQPGIDEWAAGYDLSDYGIRGQIIFGSQFWKLESEGKPIWPRVINASFISDEEREFLQKFYGNLDEQNNPSDREQVYKTLENDGNIGNRILASLVLLNFETEQNDIYAMLNQLRSKSDQLNDLTANVLRIMTQYGQKVDWSGATESIKAILNGTSVKSFLNMLEIWTRTQISPRLNEDVLTNNTFLLKEYLQSTHAESRSTTLAFVNQISGKQFEKPEVAIDWLAQF